MGFFSRLFGGNKKAVKKKAAELEPLAAPAPALTSLGAPRSAGQAVTTGISYDPNLVSKLKEDHQSLFQIYGNLTAATERGDYAAIAPLLRELKLAFQTHIMLENVKFYVYLQQSVAHDAQLSSFLAELRQEMNGIARALAKFVNTYSTGSLTVEMVQPFKAELAGIGVVLTKRVELEESRLYTLYQANY